MKALAIEEGVGTMSILHPKLFSARFQIAFWTTYASCWCVANGIDVPDTWWVLYGVVVRDCFGRHQTETAKP